MIIRYSLITGIIFINLAMAAVALLRHKTGYLAKYTTAALLLLLMLSAVRLFIPLSIPHVTVIIHSHEIIPFVESVLRTDVLVGGANFTVQSVLLAGWAAGAVVMGLRVLKNIRKLRFIQSSYKIADSSQENRIAQKLGMKRASIIVSPDIDVPYVMGIFRARIFLPQLSLGENSFEMILRHEYQHFKSGDAAIKGFYLFLSMLFWWNPFIHMFIRDLDCLLEIRCDATMSKHMTHGEKAKYMETLLCIYRGDTESPEPITASSLFRTGNEKLIVQRFKLLTSENKSFGRQLLSVMVVAALFLGSYLIIIQPTHDIPPEYLEGIFAITPENSVIVATSDGLYRIYVDGQFFGELTEVTDPFADLPIVYEER